jgi:hypothetical protein
MPRVDLLHNRHLQWLFPLQRGREPEKVSRASSTRGEYLKCTKEALTIAPTINISSQPIDLIITFLTHILAQTETRANAVTVAVAAKSFGPWLISGSPVPAGGATLAIAGEGSARLFACTSRVEVKYTRWLNGPKLEARIG